MHNRSKMLMAIGLGDESEYPEFDIPEGLDVTELEDGDEQEIVAKVRKKGDRLCLVSVNGIELNADGPDELTEDLEEEEATENAASNDEDEYVANQQYDLGAPSGTSVSDRARSAGLM